MSVKKRMGICLGVIVALLSQGGSSLEAVSDAFKKAMEQKKAKERQQQIAANLAAINAAGGVVGANPNVQNAIQADNVPGMIAAAEAVHGAGFPPPATLALVPTANPGALELDLRRRVEAIDANGPPADLQAATTNVSNKIGLGVGGAPAIDTLFVRADLAKEAIDTNNAGASIHQAITEASNEIGGAAASLLDSARNEKLRIHADGPPASIDAAITHVGDVLGNVPGLPGAGGGTLSQRAQAVKASVSNTAALPDAQAAITEVGNLLGGVGDSLKQRAAAIQTLLSAPPGGVLPSISASIVAIQPRLRAGVPILEGLNAVQNAVAGGLGLQGELFNQLGRVAAGLGELILAIPGLVPVGGDLISLVNALRSHEGLGAI